jgi:hypothetical protein
MADLQILADEITNDPLARGYAGMTDKQVADNLNVVDRDDVTPTITGSDVYDIVDDAEFEALTSADQARVRDVYALDSLPTQGSHARALIFDVFAGAGGATTRADWTTFVTGSQSRGQEIGFGRVREANVTNARAL